MAKDIPPIPHPILPQLLWCPYNKYNKEEQKLHCHIRQVDIKGFIFFVGFYFAVALIFTDVAADVPSASFGMTFIRLFLLLSSGYVWYCQNYVIPKPMQECELDFGVTEGPVGKYVWLTHQTISLHFIHHAISLCAPYLGSRIAAGTYAIAMLIGTLASFVTIQFNVLVRSDPEFVRSIRVWATRGVHMGVLDDVVHIPHLFLALIDLCIARHRSSLLLLRPTVFGLAGFVTFYVAMYTVMIHGNFALTKQWPYGFCASFGKSLQAWSKFLIVQSGILVGIYFALLLIVQVFPSFW